MSSTNKPNIFPKEIPWKAYWNTSNPFRTTGAGTDLVATGIGGAERNIWWLDSVKKATIKKKTSVSFEVFYGGVIKIVIIRRD